jgi:hypothetical protein
MERGFTVLTKVVLVVAFALNAWRAARTPITPGEAYDFVHFVRPKARDVIRNGDAGNPVLNSLLVKRAVGLFRLSEFSFRLPAVLAIGFVLSGAYRVSRLLGLAAAIGVMVWPPAGGVAVGLAFWIWGCALRRPAGLLLGLSVASSLIFLAPTAVLVGVWTIRSQDGWAVIERVALTGVAVAFIILALPLCRAERLDWKGNRGSAADVTEFCRARRWTLASMRP